MASSEYVTRDTIWPSSHALSQQTKDLIALFYWLADQKTPDAGPRMAREVFTSDASMTAGVGYFKGFDDISSSRDKAWTTVSERRHTVRMVYVNDSTGRDIMVQGQAKMVFRNMKNLEIEFAARLVVSQESQEKGQPRLESMQVFADSAPVAAATRDS